MLSNLQEHLAKKSKMQDAFVKKSTMRYLVFFNVEKRKKVQNFMQALHFDVAINFIL